MKRKYLNIILIILLFLYIYYIFTHKSIIANNIISSCSLFLYQVFPSLFPMFIISSLLINLNAPYYITKLLSFLSKYLFISPLSIYVFCLSLISGTPSSAFITKELYQKKIISSENSAKILTFSFFTNPFFLFKILSLYLPSDLVIKIILAHYIPNIIILLFTKMPTNKIPPNNNTNISSLIPNAISKSINTLTIILGTIIFFNLLTILIPDKYKTLVGFFEITNGLNTLSTLNLSITLKAFLSLTYISFGGLSIIMQIKSILNDTPIKVNKFLLSRFIHIILSYLIFIISM